MSLAFRRRRLFTHGPPVVTFLGVGQNIAFINASQILYRGLSAGSNSLGAIDRNKVIVGIIGQGNAAVPVAAAVNGVNAPVYGVTSAAAGIGVFSALIPDAGEPIINVRYNSGPTGSPVVALWSIVGLASSIPRSIASSALAGADTVRTVDVNSEVGGVAVAMAFNNITAAQTCTWSGDQTPTENAEAATGGGVYSTALIQGTSADAANTITATFGVISTTAIGLLAAAFR